LYGKLGPKLVLTNGVPTLLLSATFRPVARTGILKILKITRKNISILREELTQAETCIICIQMQSSLKSCDNLKHLYGPRNQTPDEKVVPGLVYSTTRTLNMQVLKVISIA
jgi:hypothetical protein